MKVKKVILKNFKRFDNLTIDLGDSPKRIGQAPIFWYSK
jgi:hypothetical protein